MGTIKSIIEHKEKKDQKKRVNELPFAGCPHCGCFMFNAFRQFRERPDGKLIPEEHQACANPRCLKKFEVSYGEISYDLQ